MAKSSGTWLDAKKRDKMGAQFTFLHLNEAEISLIAVIKRTIHAYFREI